MARRMSQSRINMVMNRDNIMSCLITGPIIEVRVSSNDVMDKIETILTSRQYVPRKRRIVVNKSKKDKRRKEVIVEVITIREDKEITSTSDQDIPRKRKITTRTCSKTKRRMHKPRNRQPKYQRHKVKI